MPKFTRSNIPQLKKALAVLVIIGTLAFSIVYNNFQTFDPIQSRGSAFADADLYIDLYYGRSPEVLRNPYRILTPYLARLVPDPWLSAFGVSRELSEVSRATFKFAVVNFGFLVGTSSVLYALMRGFGFALLEGLASTLLFLSLTHVVRAGGGPVAETGYWFFFALAALAIQRQNGWLLAVTMLIGMFAKEQMVWVGLLVLLAPFALRRKLLLLGALVPAGLLYLIWRFGFMPVGTGVRIPVSTILWSRLARLPSLNEGLTILLAFGLLWLPAIYALLRCTMPSLLARWIWFVPALLVFNRLMNLGNVRHTTVGFIVVVPLAIIGLRAWLELDTKEFSQ